MSHNAVFVQTSTSVYWYCTLKQCQTEDFQLDRISKRSQMVFHKNMPETLIL